MSTVHFLRPTADLLLDHRLWSCERADEGLVVLRVAAFILADFPLDLFGRVLVVVLLVSGHRLQSGEGRDSSVREPSSVNINLFTVSILLLFSTD